MSKNSNEQPTLPDERDYRHYVDVPYRMRHIGKAWRGRWDPEENSWYFKNAAIAHGVKEAIKKEKNKKHK